MNERNKINSHIVADASNIKDELDRRAKEALYVWNAQLKQLHDAPQDPSESLAHSGGFYLSKAQFLDLKRVYPEVATIWEPTFSGDYGWSHGGFYHAVEPDLYLTAPSWIERRRFSEVRLTQNMAILPDAINTEMLSYSSWIGLMGLLELIRADLTAIGWNEFWIENMGGVRRSGLRTIYSLLDWVSATLIQLLPPLNIGERFSPSITLKPPSATICLLADYDESMIPPHSRYAVRIRREGDNLFAFWGAARRFMLNGFPLSDNADVFIWGNAFGAFDLAPMLAALLKQKTTHRVSWTICRLSSHHEKQSIPDGSDNNMSNVLPLSKDHPVLDSKTATVIFCDDSTLTGTSFNEFVKQFDRHKNCTILPFFLTFDINTLESTAAKSRISKAFELSPYSVVASLWSKEAKPAARPQTVASYMKELKTSRDIQLKEIACWQPECINYLNYNRINSNRFSHEYGRIPGSISFIPANYRRNNQPGVVFIDASNAANNPYDFLSPFTYSEGIQIPVPGSSLYSHSVEGIWQGCKVIDGHIDYHCFENPPYKRPLLKDRNTRDYCYANQIFKYGSEYLDMVNARYRIYQPAYKYYFDNYIPEWFKQRVARLLKLGLDIRIHDVDANHDIDNPNSAYAHASFLCELLDEWTISHQHECILHQPVLWVVGSINRDHFRYRDETESNCIGGMAFNAARALHALGVESRLIAALGDDAIGDTMAVEIHNLFPARDKLFKTKKQATGQAHYLFDGHTTRLTSFQSGPPLGRENLSEVLSHPEDSILAVGVHPEDISLLAGSPNVYWCPGHYILDHSPTNWPCAKILFLTKQEHLSYLQKGAPEPDYLVITNHAEEVKLFKGIVELMSLKPPRKLDVLDVGAGDVFAACFVARFLNGEPPENALAYSVETTFNYLDSNRTFAHIS